MRVQAAIEELGFVPNAAARSLRSGRSGVLALALPELTRPTSRSSPTTSYAARERGWTILVDETRGELAQERLPASGIRPHLIDGLIFSPLALQAATCPRAAQRRPWSCSASGCREPPSIS